jgi:hypothetical protein
MIFKRIFKPGRHPGWWPRLILVSVLLTASGMVTTPAQAEPPRFKLAAPDTIDQAVPPGIANVRADGQGNDDTENNEADGITRTEATQEINELFQGAGPKNLVRLQNHQDGRLRIRGNIDFNRIHGSRVTPRNLAEAIPACTGCETVVIALQLNLYERGATDIEPVNAAVAVNINCNYCSTLAIALQSVYPVDDLNDTPRDVDDLIREMDQELNAIHDGQGMTTDQIEAQIIDVLNRFTALASTFDKKRAASTAQNDPTLTLTPTTTATVTTTTTTTTATATTTASPSASPAAGGGTAPSNTAPAGTADAATATATGVPADAAPPSAQATTPTPSPSPGAGP